MRIVLSIVLVAAFGLISSCNHRQRPVVKVQDRIFDHAELLTMEQEEDIFTLIKDLETEIGSQVAIVTIDSLKGKSINEFSLRTVEMLRLGREKFDDGVLIAVAVKDRAMRIEVGYGLERIIKDEIAARILWEEMTPKFRENDFAGGLILAVARIKELIEKNKELVGEQMN